VIVDTYRVGVGIKQLSRGRVDNPGMRNSIICALLAVAACSKPNPDACCTTQEQCDVVGLDGLTGCKAAGDVCNAEGACVASECTTSADCTSADEPVCINQLCVAKCTVDDDCTGLAGTPHCGGDGVCVACLDDTQCTASAPVCDSVSHACRACALDAECPQGVCLEADGVCAATSEVVYVATSNASDTNDCSESAPCATLAHALTLVDGTRRVIHLIGGTLYADAPVNITKPVHIDATGTTIMAGAAGPFVTVPDNVSPVVLAHVKVLAPTNNAITVGASSSLRLFDATIDRGIKVTGGTVDAASSTFANTEFDLPAVDCTNGSVSIASSQVSEGIVKTANCQLTLRQTLLHNNSSSALYANGGVVTIENNVFMEDNEYADCASVHATASGSTVRFNTFVNTSAATGDGVALGCDGTVDVTSNIFAYRSMHPMGPPAGQLCPAKYSLFDQIAVSEHTQGDGNVVGDASGFFAGATDYHLAAGSPAIGAAEPGLPVMTDYDGHPRPQPDGSPPDIGAFEAP
jgi:hypothetical protein